MPARGCQETWGCAEGRQDSLLMLVLPGIDPRKGQHLQPHHPETGTSWGSLLPPYFSPFPWRKAYIRLQPKPVLTPISHRVTSERIKMGIIRNSHCFFSILTSAKNRSFHQTNTNWKSHNQPQSPAVIATPPIVHARVALIPFPRRDCKYFGAHRVWMKPLAGQSLLCRPETPTLAVSSSRYPDSWPKKCSKRLFKHSNNKIATTLTIKIFLKRSYPGFPLLMEE